MRCLASFGVLALVSPLVVPATTITLQAYLKDFDPRENDLFGSSVAISGDTLVVGAEEDFGDGHGFSRAGAAYVFVRSGTNWILQASLKASYGYTRDRFGHAVALSGDTVVVGALWESSRASGVNGDENDRSAPRAGAAYVFVRNGTNWTQQAYLKASNAEGAESGSWYGGDVFGHSVAISGDTIVIGAPDEESSAAGANGDQTDNRAPRSGAAYVFVRNGTNWIQQAYLKASNPGGGELDSFYGGDQFGWSVAVSGNTVVVGAPGEESNATGVNGDQTDNSVYRCGAAYVFVRSGTNWTQQAYLKASHASSGANFAWSLALSGNTIAAGAVGASTVPYDESGAAYVFVRNGADWTLQATLEAVTSRRGDHFGAQVAVAGNTMVVGAPSAKPAGAAYVFGRSGANWSQLSDLSLSVTSRIGGSVAAANNTLVLGSVSDSHIALNSGAAYVFGAAPPPPLVCDGFCVTSFTVQPNSVTILWRAQPGETYYVGFKSALTDPNWTPVSGGITAQGTPASWTGPRAPGANAFYCVVKLDGSFPLSLDLLY